MFVLEVSAKNFTNTINKEKALSFIEEFSVIQTTKTTVNFLSVLKAKYELPLADLLIAAQTLETNGILVSKGKDFERIGELNKIIFLGCF